MAQLCRYRYNVRTGSEKDRCHGVPECMGVDVGEVVAL